MSTTIASRHSFIQTCQETALHALDNENWVLVEYLSTRLGAELLSDCLGDYDKHSMIGRNTRLNSRQEQALCLLGRITAAFSELFAPPHVLPNWLMSSNPCLNDSQPRDILANGYRGKSRQESDDMVLAAARDFLSSPLD